MEGDTTEYLKELEKWQAERAEEAARSDPDVGRLKKLDKQIAAWKKALGVEEATPEKSIAAPSDLVVEGDTQTDTGPTLAERLKDMLEAAGLETAGSYTQAGLTIAASGREGGHTMGQEIMSDTLEGYIRARDNYQAVVDAYENGDKTYGGYPITQQGYEDAKDYIEQLQWWIDIYEAGMKANDPDNWQDAYDMVDDLMQKGAEAGEAAKEGMNANQQQAVDKGINYIASLYNIPISAITSLPPSVLNMVCVFGNRAYETAQNGGDARAQLKDGMQDAGTSLLLNALLNGLRQGNSIDWRQADAGGLVPIQPGGLIINDPLFGTTAQPAADAVRQGLTTVPMTSAIMDTIHPMANEGQDSTSNGKIQILDNRLNNIEEIAAISQEDKAIVDRLFEQGIQYTQRINEKEIIVSMEKPHITEMRWHAIENLRNKPDRAEMTLERAQDYVNNAKLIIYQQDRDTLKFISEDGYAILNSEYQLATAVPQKWRKKYDQYLDKQNK